MKSKVPNIDFVDVATKVKVGELYACKKIHFVKDAVDGLLEIADSPPEANGKKAGAEIFYDKGWYTVKGSVDTSTEGVYTFEIDASDANGNTKHCTFDVMVAAPEPESETPEATMMMRPMPSQKVYWTPNGDVYHHSRGRPALSRSKVI